MEFDYQILSLAPEFFKTHPVDQFPELLQKDTRAYNCLVLDTMYDYFICIPFRTEMHHKNGYKFKNSKRARRHQSGLDYSKIVILTDAALLSSLPAIVDSDEYNETVKNIQAIAKDAADYVTTYTRHMNGEAPLHSYNFQWKYAYSTLQYFHAELGLLD